MRPDGLFDPLLAKVPASTAGWDGAYIGTTASRDDDPMLLHVTRTADGHVFSIYARGSGRSVVVDDGPLSLVGRGEAHIVDLDDRFAVAETRCEIAIPGIPGTSAGDAWNTLLDATRLFRAVREISTSPPRVLGPYVYLLIHKRGDTFETLLGIQQGGDDAARAHRIDRASLSGIAGASDVLIAEDAIFTEDDVHIRFTSRSDALLAFFRDAAAAEFNDVTKMPGNAVRWRRVDIGHLRSLELGNVFPPEGALRGWCDLRLAELE